MALDRKICGFCSYFDRLYVDSDCGHCRNVNSINYGSVESKQSFCDKFDDFFEAARKEDLKGVYKERRISLPTLKLTKEEAEALHGYLVKGDGNEIGKGIYDRYKQEIRKALDEELLREVGLR